MITKILKIWTSLILLGFLLLGLIILIPVNYKVEPPTKRENNQYWQLNTGSKIGYLKNESKSEIDVLSSTYINTFVNDLRDVVRYEKNSNYITSSLITTENTNVVNP